MEDISTGPDLKDVCSVWCVNSAGVKWASEEPASAQVLNTAIIFS